MKNKSPWIALAALAALSTAGVAQARSDDVDVRWQITIGSPAPVRVHAPAPVVVAAPVYAPMPVYPAVPRRVGYGPSRAWDADGDGIPTRHDRVYNPRWDIDGDGIPNHRDRLYNPRWDVDGDGVPNRYDRDDRGGYRRDRDRDGIPDRHDRRPDLPQRGWGR